MATTYRDQPLLKPPVWTWEVPAYFFVGGIAGTASIVACAAMFAGDGARTLMRDAKLVAAAGALLSPLLLISDLGRPARFLHMLRVFKPRSPMSVGVWTLVLFSGAAFGALVPTDLIAMPATVLAAISGAVLATYTGVLIGATAIPAWSRHVSLLPVHFGASGLGAAVAVLELLGHRTPQMNVLGLMAAATETALIAWLWMRGGSHGAMMRAAEAFSGPIPLVMRLTLASNPVARVAIAIVTLAGSLMTRFAWIAAGRESARRTTSGQ